MKIHIRGMDVDLDNEVDLFFLNETLIYDKIKELESLESSDIYTKIYKKDVIDTYLRRANTGSWDAYKDIVHTYDEERFENVSKDFTMCWKKSDKQHDKLIILLTSYAGHEGRLTSPLTNISDKIINLDTDLLIVNEDPFRYPESLYPSVMMLGVSEQNNTQEKTCNQIREYIKKEYKNVIIYADSKHVASSLSLAYNLKDIVTNVFLTGGQATFSWEHSPWVKQYMKWHNRPEHLKDQHLAMIYPAILHIVRCWKFKKLNLSPETVDPFRFLSEYPKIKVDYLYGKYDTDYVSFLHYIKQFKCNNISIEEIDYKISDSQTHNIRPYVDRNILKGFVESL